jgi:hypothetical protein
VRNLFSMMVHWSRGEGCEKAASDSSRIPGLGALSPFRHRPRAPLAAPAPGGNSGAGSAARPAFQRTQNLRAGVPESREPALRKSARGRELSMGGLGNGQDCRLAFAPRCVGPQQGVDLSRPILARRIDCARFQIPISTRSRWALITFNKFTGDPPFFRRSGGVKGTLMTPTRALDSSASPES